MDHGNFGDLIRRSVTLFPEKTAIAQGNVSLSFAALDERSQRLAALLTGFGVGRGDRVLVLLPNDYRFAESLLGILRTGAAAVPVNIKLGAETLAYIAAHSEARVLIAHADLTEQARAMIGSPHLRHALAAGGGIAGAASYDEWLAATPAGFATVTVRPEEEAMLMYTSGSTGMPKGVRLSHANKWWQARSFPRCMLADEHDRALVTGPLYHANALWACMLPMLFVGGSLVILPEFEPAAVLDAIARDRPTYLSGTPSMYTLLLAEHARTPGRDLSSVEFLLCGSAPVPEELLRALESTFGCVVVESYGLTEGGANVITPRWGVKKLGSCGLPVPDVEVRIADLDDPTRDCPPGVIGELWSRSPANALGYLKQPEATAERFTADGWLRTGDLMRADEQGYISFCGRADDMINVGGENVYPKEVETILLSHPAIDDVCVVPAPHRVKGQAPVAWVVLRTPGSLSEEEVRRYFLVHGPAYAHPRRVFFTDRLPLSGTNKVDRKGLQEEAARLLPDGLGAGAESDARAAVPR